MLVPVKRGKRGSRILSPQRDPLYIFNCVGIGEGTLPQNSFGLQQWLILCRSLALSLARSLALSLSRSRALSLSRSLALFLFFLGGMRARGPPRERALSLSLLHDGMRTARVRCYCESIIPSVHPPTPLDLTDISPSLLSLSPSLSLSLGVRRVHIHNHHLPVGLACQHWILEWKQMLRAANSSEQCATSVGLGGLRR